MPSSLEVHSLMREAIQAHSPTRLNSRAAEQNGGLPPWRRRFVWRQTQPDNPAAQTFLSPRVNYHIRSVVDASETMHDYLKTVRKIKNRIELPAEIPLFADFFYESALTGRELEVLYGMASGLKYEDIANALAIKNETFKGYAAKILTKLPSVAPHRSREDAVANAIALGYTPPRLLAEGPQVGVRENYRQLFDAELRVYNLLTTPGVGYSNVDISERVALSEETVKTNVASIFHKLHIPDRMGVRIFDIQRRAFVRAHRVAPHSLDANTYKFLVRVLLKGTSENSHLNAVYSFLHARSGTEAIAHAIQWGLLTDRDHIYKYKQTLLSDADREFMVRLGSIRDDRLDIDTQAVEISRRVFPTEISERALQARLSAIREILDVETNREAAIIAKLADIDRPYPTGWLAEANSWDARLRQELERYRNKLK